MSSLPIVSFERMPPAELLGLVRNLIAEVGRLRAENEKLSEALAMQRVENQALKDEIARLKHLPPRPPLKPSGMDKATDRPEVWAEGEKGKASKRRRGPGVSKLSIDRTVTPTVKPAAGARHKGYEEIVVQDLMLRAETTLLSARALADAGRRHADRAPRYGDRRRLRPPSAPARADAPFSGPDAVRTHRGAAGRAWLGHLQAAGGSAPDRQTGPVPRRGRGRVAGGAHRRAVRHRRRHRGAPRWQGLLHHPHRRRPVRGLPHRAGQIAPGFLEPSARRGGALCHQRRRPRLHARGHLPRDVIDRLAGHALQAFGSHAEWMGHLHALGLTDLRVTPDPVRVASEAALWGAIEAEGLLGGAVIVSDDAGQFRVGEHALCWVHAERLIHKLIPANDKQRNAVEVAKRMVWWFYRQLKDYKLAPNPCGPRS